MKVLLNEVTIDLDVVVRLDLRHRLLLLWSLLASVACYCLHFLSGDWKDCTEYIVVGSTPSDGTLALPGLSSKTPKKGSVTQTLLLGGSSRNRTTILIEADDGLRFKDEVLVMGKFVVVIGRLITIVECPREFVYILPRDIEQRRRQPKTRRRTIEDQR
ncbi:hypothetical protein Dimus_036563 [Dionaea muscipula]